MIRRLVTLAAAALIISSTARAQTTTDGVDAFLRGDYRRAVQILGPLVSPTQPPDHIAEFFLAAMYENGLGVPIDPTRACALYARVAADSTGAFAAQGAALMDAVSQLLGPDPVKECLAAPASPPRDDPDSGSAFVSEPAARAPKIRGRASRRTRGRHRAGASNGSLSRAISPQFLLDRVTELEVAHQLSESIRTHQPELRNQWHSVCGVLNGGSICHAETSAYIRTSRSARPSTSKKGTKSADFRRTRLNAGRGRL